MVSPARLADFYGSQFDRELPVSEGTCIGAVAAVPTDKLVWALHDCGLIQCYDLVIDDIQWSHDYSKKPLAILYVGGVGGEDGCERSGRPGSSGAQGGELGTGAGGQGGEDGEQHREAAAQGAADGGQVSRPDGQTSARAEGRALQSTVFHRPGTAPRPPRIWVVDAGEDCILWLDVEDGDWLATICSSGPGSGELSRPQGLTILHDGSEVWVADMENHRLQGLCASTGRPLHEIGQGHLAYPVDVEAMRGDRLAVVDKEGGHVFDHGGACVFTFDRHFMIPTAVLYDPRSSGGLLLVTDEYTGRLMLFDAGTGNHLRSLETLGLCAGTGARKGLAWSEDLGHVLVSDGLNRRLGYLRPPPVFNAEVRAGEARITDAFGSRVGVVEGAPGSTTLGELRRKLPLKEDEQVFLVSGDVALDGPKSALLSDSLVVALPSFNCI